MPADHHRARSTGPAIAQESVRETVERHGRTETVYVQDAVEDVVDAEMMVTFGGPSVDDCDLVPEVADDVSDIGDVVFHGLAVKPGHPAGFAVVNDTSWLKLPGTRVKGGSTYLHPGERNPPRQRRFGDSGAGGDGWQRQPVEGCKGGRMAGDFGGRRAPPTLRRGSREALESVTSDAAGLVLAGGGSRRFRDGDKALAELRGRTLIDHVVREIDMSVEGAVYVAVASEDESRRYEDHLDVDVEWVVDPDCCPAGPVAGVAAGVHDTEASVVFVAACDMPLIDAAVVEPLLDEMKSEVDAVVPLVDGRQHPLHAVYDVDSLERCLTQDGPENMMEVVDSLDRVRWVERGQLGVAEEMERSVSNVNTVDDLRHCMELL